MEQLEVLVKELRNAMDEAEEYAAAETKIAEGINVHRQFLMASCQEIEKLVMHLSKKNKTENVELPPEVREATIMMKRLALAYLSVQKVEKSVELQMQNQPTSVAATQSQIVVSKAPIPSLQIPSFEGNTLQYKNFITIFDETVHKNTALQPSQKLAYLLQYVSGDAKNMIGRMPISDENYQIARDLLAENYGDESRNISILYDRLRQLQPVADEPFALRDLYNECESIIRILQQAGQDIEGNAYLYDELLKKYPFSFIISVVLKEDMSFEQFRKEAGRTIKLRVRLAQRTDNIPQKYRNTVGEKNQLAVKKAGPPALMNVSPAVGEPVNEKSTWRRGLRSNADKAVPYCSFCSDSHFSDECKKYVTLEQRINTLKDRCHRCFRKAHPNEQCIRDHPCFYCRRTDHHRALCPTRFEEKARSMQLAKSQQEKEQSTRPGKFLTFVVMIVNPENNHSKEIRVCLDTASDTTVISTAVAEELGINSSTAKYTKLQGLGGTPLPEITESEYTLRIPTQAGNAVQIVTKLTKAEMPSLRAPDIVAFKNQFPKHSSTPIPPTGQGRRVEMILGADMANRILTLQRSIFVDSNNQLLSTRCGYLLLQSPDDKGAVKEESNTFLMQKEDEVRRMWELDIIGLKYAEEKESSLEEQALNEFYRTIKFIQGRYQVKWPWRSFPPNLPNNFGLAYGRLKSLQRKLADKPELLAAYDAIIREQLLQDIVEIVPESELRTSNVVHHIPHHAVIDLERSTPIRIVYDASTKIRGYDSLNESILKGTRWTGDLMASLLRFRIDRTAVSADVKRAFHQILIDSTDRDVMRFLWLKNPALPPTEDNILTFRFKRMVFGVVASPFLLYAVLQNHFMKNPSNTNTILSKEMYADNLLTSLPPNIDPVKFYRETRETFQQMSMEMVKWTSNDPMLRSNIPEEVQIPEKITTALGLSWNVLTDELSLKTCKTEHLQNKMRTKRITLKILASLFDPVGWAIPIAVTARIFIRKLWQLEFKWDKTLPTELAEEWESIQKSIDAVTEVTVPRQYIGGNIDLRSEALEMHVFVDASADAYAAVVYLRIRGDGSQPVAFIMARARLAPVNQLSIPRLELLAAVAGTRLIRYVIVNMKLEQEIRTILWSDSKCVLAWINTCKILPSVVNRQVNEIRQANIDEFRHVPSLMNPADTATRKTDFQTMKNSHWQKPEWLINTESWPVMQSINEESIESAERSMLLLEKKKAAIIYPDPAPLPLPININQFADLNSLLRRTSYCLLILNTVLRREFVPLESRLDYAYSKRLWIRSEQNNAYAELRDLKTNEKRNFNGFTVTKDEFGLIRTVLRISKAELPEETKQPILLVRKSHLTKLIILDLHHRNMHSGTNYTLAALRRSYNLPSARREIYGIIKRYCMNCKRYDARPYKTPPMGQLPEFRVMPTSTPFQKIGIDTFGPIETVDDLRTEKRYVLIITCLVVRAVHLEVLYTLETVEIIDALKRCFARRGTPTLILSDNAKQFVLVNGVLSDIWVGLQQSDEGAKYFAEHEIRWEFIPEYGPWVGGVYERLIQSVKSCFRRTYAERKISTTQLTTAMAEVEGVLNNRPLTYVSREVHTSIITPNHFLRVQFPAIPVELKEERCRNPIVESKTRKEILTLWRESEELLTKYWRMWTEQYLLALRESPMRVGSNKPSTKQPEVGDTVLMIDPSNRRGYWRVGLVEKLMIGGDGHVRSALVKPATGNRMIRPIARLAPFEVPESLRSDVVPSVSSLEISPPGSVDEIDDINAESSIQIPLVQLVYGRYEEEMQQVTSYNQSFGDRLRLAECHELESSRDQHQRR